MLKGEQMMRILVDADACPVIGIVERIAKAHGIPVTLLCDTNHVLKSDYSDVKVISAGADAVDFALINLCERAVWSSYRIMEWQHSAWKGCVCDLSERNALYAG